MEITRNGLVKVRAPYGISRAEIQEFVASKEAWILKHLKRIEQNKASYPELLSARELEMLAQKALQVLPGKVEYYAAKIGVTYGTITIRNQKTHWGSCSSKGDSSAMHLLARCKRARSAGCPPYEDSDRKILA